SSSTAGMRMLRMTIASRKTAVAIATPKSLSTRSSPAAKEAKTTTMTAAAAVMTRPVLASPSRTAALASPRCCHSSWMRETRKTLVHREAEDDREDQHGDERVDRSGLDADEAG